VNANATWYAALNDTPGLVGPPIGPPPADVREYWRAWLDGDGYPFWSYWENLRTWWEIRDLPNVMLVHYAAMTRDLAGQMRRIAEFLGVTMDEADWPNVLEYCSFDWMKRNATKSVPLGGAFWDAGAQVFINQGRNGRWNEQLTAGEKEEYERLAVEKLGAQCARWLATGEGNP
jgi:aryl sulfotransferase